MDQSTPPTGRSAGSSSASNGEPSSTGANYAFLVHSQDTLPNNLPPTVDNKSLARQKRRRTSPEDQAILEEEYQRNPKPDKVARMDIVNRVALGEKEVQIWFQNRRQNTRRRTKPLSPDELPDPFSSQDTETATVPMESVTSCLSDQNAPVDHRNDETEPHVRPNDKLVDAKLGPVGNEQPRSAPMSNVRQSSSQAATSLDTSQASHTDIRSESFMASSQESLSTLATEVSEFSGKEANRADIKSNMQESGYLSNRRRSFYDPFGVKPSSDKPHSQPGVARKIGMFSNPKDIPSQLSGSRVTSSTVRLRLSIDGKAQVVTEEDEILPWSKTVPPANNLLRSRGLQRSQSAVHVGQRTVPNANGPAADWPRRPGLSRSKTSRPWELYCDNEVKDVSKAEGYQSGSGATSIAQLKAGNDTSLLRPNVNKRNAPTSRFEPSKRVKPNADGGPKTKTPSLVRSNSSLPRLQTQSNPSKELSKMTKPKSTKASLQPALLRSPSGDSDKENWVPDDDWQANGRRPTNVPQGHIGSQVDQGTSQGNPIATNGVGGSSQGNRLNSITGHSESARLSDERGRQQNVEVESDILHMSRNAEDLDCVQNLLSLSQGNWQ